VHGSRIGVCACAWKVGRCASWCENLFKESGRRECPEEEGVSMEELEGSDFLGILLLLPRFHPSFSPPPRNRFRFP
jgi:hypothetical protein